MRDVNGNIVLKGDIVFRVHDVNQPSAAVVHKVQGRGKTSKVRLKFLSGGMGVFPYRSSEIRKAEPEELL